MLLSSTVINKFECSLFLDNFMLISPKFLGLSFTFSSSKSLFFIYFTDLIISSVINSCLISVTGWGISLLVLFLYTVLNSLIPTKEFIYELSSADTIFSKYSISLLVPLELLYSSILD